MASHSCNSRKPFQALHVTFAAALLAGSAALAALHTRNVVAQVSVVPKS
jgi:hypothetical protein